MNIWFNGLLVGTRIRPAASTTDTAMASKGKGETIVSKLGFKSSSSASKAEAELERVRKENAYLKKKIDELAKRATRPPDSDKSKLLERILSLETLRERNNQQLLVKEQELESMRQQLSAKGGEVVASLQAQLEQRRKEAEQRDALFQSLSQETENLKNKLATVSARCQSLDTQNGQSPPADLALVQDQLRDALEKNQQWLIYDQQRETYVQSILAHTRDLEQQLAQAKQQQPKQEANSDAEKSDSEKDPQLKSQHDQLLSGLQKDLESQKDQVGKAQQELSMQREQTTSTAKNREGYSIVQKIPSDSSDDEYRDDSDDEWLPENNRDIGDADDSGDADSQSAESQDADSQDDEGQGGQHDEGALENVRMVPAQRKVHKAPACTQARKYVLKLHDNDFIFKAFVAHAPINAGSHQQSRRGRPSGTPTPAKRRRVTKVPSHVRTVKAQTELQSQREQVARLQEEIRGLQRRYEDKCSEVSSFLRKYEEKGKELEEAKMQLQAEQLGNRHVAYEEQKVSSERAERMRMELENMHFRLEEERKRSDELLLQVDMLQKSLLRQNKKQERIAVLEQQIQLSATDLENEKSDRQSMQQKLHKVQKELRKALDQIANLEAAKQQNARFSEPSTYNRFEFERLNITDPTSPSKVTDLLDESFLECPKCQASYPASRHKELLVHIDYCYD